MTELLSAAELVKYYPPRSGLFGTRRATVRAVDSVSLRLDYGETLALVGESGCGKSTLARLVLRLIDLTSGAIQFDGEDITTLRGEALRRLRRRMQIVFQDPFASLNPRMSVREIIEEPLLVHGIGDRSSRRARSAELLALVGLDRASAERRPNEFSGGQRQRIGIARALAPQPDLVVCDEPVSALDVSIQAQVINLLKDLQAQFRLSYLFIAHDLAVVKHVADRVAVMYLGRIVESGPKDAIFATPSHPYTRALLASVPRTHPHLERERQIPEGDIPSAMAVPSGCRFHTRCPHAIEICRQVEPSLAIVGDRHLSACHRSSSLPGFPVDGITAATTPVAERLKLYDRYRDRAASASP